MMVFLLTLLFCGLKNKKNLVNKTKKKKEKINIKRKQLAMLFALTEASNNVVRLLCLVVTKMNIYSCNKH